MKLQVSTCVLSRYPYSSGTALNNVVASKLFKEMVDTKNLISIRMKKNNSLILD